MKAVPTFWFCTVLLLGCIITIHAESGGYTGPGLTVVTTQEVKKFRDDTPVLLQGKIVRFLGDEKYLFADDSGTIIAEIDDRLWKDIFVNENDTVEINGKVDRNFRKVEIEVNNIKKIIK